MAQYASGVKIDNIFNIVHQGQPGGYNATVNSSLINSDDNFSLVNIDEKSRRKQPANAEVELFQAQEFESKPEVTKELIHLSAEKQLESKLFNDRPLNSIEN